MATVVGFGVISREPQLRYTEQGRPWCTTTIAEPWINDNGEEKLGNFHSVTCWGKLGEQLAELNEGDRLLFRGDLRYRANDYYESEDGKNPWLAQITIRAYALAGEGWQEEGNE